MSTANDDNLRRLVGCHYEPTAGPLCGKPAVWTVPTRDFPLCREHARIWRRGGVRLERIAANARLDRTATEEKTNE